MPGKVLMLASVASMIDQFNIPNIKLLIEMGYKVDVACNFIDGNTCSDAKIAELKNKLKDMDVNCHQIDFARSVKHIWQNFKAYRQVLKLMLANRYAFIHCHSPIGGVCGRLAGRKTHTKVIYTAHGFHFYKGAPLLNWIIYYPIENFLSRYTDVLITINKEDYAIAKNKMYAKKTKYIPGVGIDVEKIQNIKVDRNKKRKELGIPQDAIVLLSVGELSKRKNHEIVIKALAKLMDINIVYVICGKGPLKEYLTRLAEQLNVNKKVFFMGFRSDIIEICKASDVFIFPSLQEGLPVSLMEAVTCNLPIICSNIRGNSDLVANYHDVYLISPYDIDGIVDSLHYILTEGTHAYRQEQNISDIDIRNVMKLMQQIYKDTFVSSNGNREGRP